MKELAADTYFEKLLDFLSEEYQPKIFLRWLNQFSKPVMGGYWFVVELASEQDFADLNYLITLRVRKSRKNRQAAKF